MSIEKLSTNASLKDVIDKFEEISLMDFSSLNVITATELPSKGKEGQLCIITDIEPNMIYFDYIEPDLAESEIFLQYKLDDSHEDFNVSSSKANIRVKIRSICQIKNGVKTSLNGYVYIGDEWKYIGVAPIIIFKEGIGDISSITGGYKAYLSKDGTHSVNSNYIHIYTSPSANYSTYHGIISVNGIDVTDYTKMKIDVAVSRTSSSVSPTAMISLSNTSAGGGWVVQKVLGVSGRGVIELDITNVTGINYIDFYIGGVNTSTRANAEMHIYNLYLE